MDFYNLRFTVLVLYGLESSWHLVAHSGGTLLVYSSHYLVEGG